MCHYFVRIKLPSVIISRWCDSHEKYPHIHLAHALPAHMGPHTHMRLLPIWTPDLFQPSDSHWHLLLELRLLTCWSWWEWMMLLLEEKRRSKESGGREGVKIVGTRVDKLPTRPWESIWTPCSPERSQGDSALHPHYKRATTVTIQGAQYSLVLCHTTCHLPSLSTVIMEETYSM